MHRLTGKAGSPRMRRSRGLTLMELMIVVAILGILVSVAYPSYQSMVQQSRRADAQTALIALQMAQTAFRGNCPHYAQNIGSSNSCGSGPASSTVDGRSSSQEGYYQLSIEAGSATGNAYTLVATPQGSQAGDSDCSPITLTVNPANPEGQRAPADCW